MLLSESKYFPGHPSMSPGPFSPSTAAAFSRKDIFNQRKQREFIPENKKDDSYWDRRRRNNEAAKRSREKRRLNDMLLETRVLELTKDNHILQAQLSAIYEKYGIRGETMISMERVLATLPTNDQVLNFTKKRVGSTCSGGMGSPSPSPLSFQSLALPLMNNNNNNNNNNSSSSNNNNNNTMGTANNNNNYHSRQRSCSPSPARSYRSPSPLMAASRCYSPAVIPPAAMAAAAANYADYAESGGHMYRRPLLSSSSSSSKTSREVLSVLS
jgi:vrille protein